MGGPEIRAAPSHWI